MAKISTWIKEAKCSNPDCGAEYLCELDDGEVITYPQHPKTREPIFEEMVFYCNKFVLQICVCCNSKVELTTYNFPEK